MGFSPPTLASLDSANDSDVIRVHSRSRLGDREAGGHKHAGRRNCRLPAHLLRFVLTAPDPGESAHYNDCGYRRRDREGGEHAGAVVETCDRRPDVTSEVVAARPWLTGGAPDETEHRYPNRRHQGPQDNTAHTTDSAWLLVADPLVLGSGVTANQSHGNSEESTGSGVQGTNRSADSVSTVPQPGEILAV
jgi:hypothetical protein